MTIVVDIFENLTWYQV